jgi:hypothetical protein
MTYLGIELFCHTIEQFKSELWASDGSKLNNSKVLLFEDLISVVSSLYHMGKDCSGQVHLAYSECLQWSIKDVCGQSFSSVCVPAVKKNCGINSNCKISCDLYNANHSKLLSNSQWIQGFFNDKLSLIETTYLNHVEV